jgi:hypothetical protein
MRHDAAAMRPAGQACLAGACYLRVWPGILKTANVS